MEFKLGDRIMCTDDGECGYIVEIDAEYGGAVVAFDSGYESWIDIDSLDFTNDSSEDILKIRVQEFIDANKTHSSRREIIRLIEEMWN